jgi:predicted SAM-dependent methyltransferase
VEVVADPSLAAERLHGLGLRGLHCGSGSILLTGCLNTDGLRLEDESGNSTEPGRLALVDGVNYYLEHDSTERFPLETDTFDWIYSEHFIEHLQPQHGIKFFRQTRRLMRPGGVVRLSTPDLRKYMSGYLEPGQEFFKEHLRRIAHLPAMSSRGAPDRPAFMVNQCFYLWGHRWIYDFDELRHAATEAGFPAEACVERSFREGLFPELAALDQEWRNHESIYFEAVND